MSVFCTRADVDGDPGVDTATTLLATRADDGEWLVHLCREERAAVYVTEGEMVRWATAILHLAPAAVARGAWATAHPQGGPNPISGQRA